MKRIETKQIKQARALGLMASLCALLLLAAPSWGGKARQPLWEQITVAPIVIESQPMEGAAARSDETAFQKSLSEAASKEARDVLVKARLAAKAEAVPVATPDSFKGMTFSGTIHLPLSLPPSVIGLRAHNRKGIFATAHFTVRDAEGKSVAEQDVALKWKSVRWTRGAPRWRRNRQRDDVLEGAVRRTVEIGVWQLGAQLAKSSRPSP